MGYSLLCRPAEGRPRGDDPARWWSARVSAGAYIGLLPHLLSYLSYLLPYILSYLLPPTTMPTTTPYLTPYVYQIIPCHRCCYRRCNHTPYYIYYHAYHHTPLKAIPITRSYHAIAVATVDVTTRRTISTTMPWLVLPSM